jgi:Putative zinc-finger
MGFLVVLPVRTPAADRSSHRYESRTSRVRTAMRTETCPDDDELAAFVEHALPAARRLELEAHVDACGACREAIGHVAAMAPAH